MEEKLWLNSLHLTPYSRHFWVHDWLMGVCNCWQKSTQISPYLPITCARIAAWVSSSSWQNSDRLLKSFNQIMYAIKLELKLNNKERTLMARHSGYARFCYNYALSLYQEVKSLPGGRSKKSGGHRKEFSRIMSRKCRNTNGRTPYLLVFTRWHSGILVRLCLVSSKD